MDTVKQLTLIETTLKRVGEGIVTSPIRILTQYWTLGGEMVFEIDPCAKPVTPERIKEIREAIINRLGENDKAGEMFTDISFILSQ